jgi:uncharacterized protein involved in cysteine biosynthesis
MFLGLARALGQLTDRRLRRVIWRSLFWSVLTFAGLLTLAWTILAKTTLFETGWLETATHLLGGATALALAFLMFPGIVSTVVSFYLDAAADAVEARHYKDLPAPRPPPLSQQIAVGARILALTAVVNIVVLAVSVAVPGSFPFVFYGLNGYLLGREYFELVAMRRMDFQAARRLRRRHRWYVTGAGAIIAGLLSIPVAGWFMPVVATAFMVHLVVPLQRAKAA